MARVNIYLPNDLAEEAKAARLNVSGIAQEALRAELDKRRVSDWVEAVSRLPATGVTHEEILAALDEARAEMWGDDA